LRRPVPNRCFRKKDQDVGVDITGDKIGFDLVAAGEELPLPPGVYWLTVYPSYNVTCAGGARWNWFQAALVGEQTKLIL
jgi:hypothetical protein